MTRRRLAYDGGEQTIERVAEDGAYDMVVMGLRGLAPFRRPTIRWTSSVSRRRGRKRAADRCRA